MHQQKLAKHETTVLTPELAKPGTSHTNCVSCNVVHSPN